MKFLGSIINSVGEIQLSLIGTIFVYAKIGHDILISSKPGSTIFSVGGKSTDFLLTLGSVAKFENQTRPLWPSVHITP